LNRGIHQWSPPTAIVSIARAKASLALNKEALSSLVIILISFVIHDIVESQFVNALGSCHNAQPVSELLFLEVLLGALLGQVSRV
jgi:hypothetical protein